MSLAAIIAAATLVSTACNQSTSGIPAATVPNTSTTESTTEIETVDTSKTSSQESTEKQSETSTQKSTEKQSETSTQKSSKKESETSTQSSAEKQSETSSQSSTEKQSGTSETSTQKSTEKQSEVSSQSATEKQSETSTQKPTENATEAPTQKATEKATEAHKHSYTSSVTKASTCSSDGVMTFSCSCGDSYTETIGKTAHSFSGYTYNNDATYESDGTESAMCSVCGERTTRTAAGTKLVHVHSYAETVTTAPSCTAEGVMTFSCSCGDSYTEAIPAAGHQFSDYTYNNDATTSADGTQTRYCLVCGEIETVTAEGTKKSLPSWYDEHWQQLNTTMGGQSDGSLEAYFVAGQFNWDAEADGCWDLGYNATSDIVGVYAEGLVEHGYLYK